MENIEATTQEKLIDGTPVSVTRIFQDFDTAREQERDIAVENQKRMFRPKFIPFYPFLLDKNLSLIEIVLFGFIDFYTPISESGRFYFTNEQLGRLLNCSIQTISNSIGKLEKLGLIKTNRKIKANGGQIRFIDILLKNCMSDYKKINSPSIKELLTNNNKINNNKIKENKINNSYMFFLEKFNELTGRKFKILDNKTNNQIKNLLANGYTLEDWATSVTNASKDKYITGGNDSGKYYLTPEFISRPQKFEQYLGQVTPKAKQKYEGLNNNQIILEKMKEELANKKKF